MSRPSYLRTCRKGVRIHKEGFTFANHKKARNNIYGKDGDKRKEKDTYYFYYRNSKKGQRLRGAAREDNLTTSGVKQMCHC
jgi:hypothetical protein